jgi:hypothetical protein
MNVELVSELEPLLLFDAIDAVETLSVEWAPDDELMRDKLLIKGTIDAEQVRLLAMTVVPNLEELIEALDEGWQAGARGLAQVVILHAISVRLRAVAPSLEAA